MVSDSTCNSARMAFTKLGNVASMIVRIRSGAVSGAALTKAVLHELECGSSTGSK